MGCRGSAGLSRYGVAARDLDDVRGDIVDPAQDQPSLLVALDRWPGRLLPRGIDLVTQ